MRNLIPSVVFVLTALSLSLADPKPAIKTPLSEPRQRLLKGNYEEARAGFLKHIADPKYGPDAWIGIARSYRDVGKYDDALAALNDGLKNHTNNGDLLAARGDLYFELGKWDEALADATTALKQKDDHMPARWVRARIYRDSGRLDEASDEMRWFVRTYTAASNADKDITDPELLLLIGQAGAEHARWHSLPKQFAFILNEVYGDALKYDPDLWPAEQLIGEMLLEKYNRPDAVEAFDKVLTMNPKAAEPYVGKARAALQKYEIREAEEYITEALYRNPKLCSALCLKADIHVMSGELPIAEKALREALAVNPRHEIASGKLAGLMMLMKRSSAAAEIEKSVAAYDARPAVFFHEMGAVLEDQRDYVRAEECYIKSAKLRANLAAPRTSLGMLYLRLGRESDGRKLLEESFKADKFNVRVANSLKVLEHMDRYQSIRTPHYEIKYDGAVDRLLAPLIAEYVEEVHADLKKQFQYEPSGVIPIQIFSKHEMFSGRTVGLPDLHTVGACTGRVVAMASPKAAGVLKPFNWGRVIRHELVHIFNLAQTNYRCPHWLTEGLAVRNEKMKHPHLWTRTLLEAYETENLFNLDDIMIGFVKPRNQSVWILAYCQSHLYVDYAIAQYGEEVIPKLMKAYSEGLDTTQAIRQACGIEKDVFEAGYKVHLEKWLLPYRIWEPIEDPTERLTLDELETALSENPGDTDIKARLAEHRFRKSEFAESRKLADEVLAKEPGHPVATIVRSRLLKQAGDNEAATETLAKAVEKNPKNPRLLLALGRIHIETKEYDKAATVLEKGRKYAPLEGDWLDQLARVYSAIEDNAKLQSVLEEMAAHDPDDVDVRLRLGRLLLATDAPKSLEYAKEAMRIDVTNLQVQKLLIEALKASGSDAETMQKRFAEK